MKSKARKQEDLNVLTEQLKNSKTAMVLSFNKLTVDKDQEFRNELRGTGATYRVVKNTLARLAVEGTPFEEAKEHFVGVTSIATTDSEPMDLSKVVSKYVKDSKGIFEFKAGIVDGRVVDFSEVEKIASLPSKEELIGKLLYLLNAPAQRLATVLNAIPRDLAVVLKQVSERTDNIPGEEAKAEAPQEEKSEDTKQADVAPEEASSTEEESKAADEKDSDKGAQTKTEEAPEAEQKSEEENSEEKADEQKEESAGEEKSEDSEEKDS